MRTAVGETFKDAVRRLHCAKDAAYRDSWKKRGEVMSIMANLARKVDRLEYVYGGAVATHDESLFDTVIDLLVYSLKYQTYLADQDPTTATMLFDRSGTSSPYSDGLRGFEAFLSQLDVTPLDQADGPNAAQATQYVLAAFADLEACFQGTPVPIDRRAERARVLTRATVTLLGALKREAPERYRDFLITCFNDAR